MLVPTTRDAYEFFKQGTLALAKMEHHGIAIDEDFLSKVLKQTKEKILELNQKLRDDHVYQVWRKRFREPNLTSRAQLAEVLFGVLGHRVRERTSTGRAKADERNLERVKIPFVTTFLKKEKLNKVYGTYLKGIKKELVDGRVHPSYNLAGGLEDEQKGGASSYRGSCSNPNFTNMPIRNKTMAALIRPNFVADSDDYYLGEIDYKTLEVKIAAATTGDKRLKAYVSDPDKDMHHDAAKLLFMLKDEQVGRKTTRDAAKNKFIFPQFYGDGYVSCSEAIWESMRRNKWKIEGSNRSIKRHLEHKGITSRGKCSWDHDPVPGTFEYQVKKVENIIWNDWFPEYTAWKKDWYRRYLRTGKVALATGFTATGIYRRNQVLNLPIQGPAYHCLLWSIIELTEEFEKRGLRSRIVGHIHDCVLISIHKNEVQEVLELCRKIMTIRLRKHWKWITVPLEIEVDLSPRGKSWNDKEPWVYKNKVWEPKAA